jgi:hypothetical protein
MKMSIPSAFFLKLIDRPAFRNRPGKGSTQDPVYFWVGLTLLGGFFLQLAFGWHSRWLAEQQTHELYKQLSGLLLLLFICHQCWLSLQRTQGEPGTARHALAHHKRWGSVAPLLFYFHSISPGHAYLLVLSLSFFAVFTLGLLHQQLLRWQPKWLTQLWLIGHVALTMVLLILLGYHVYVAFVYE